MAPKRRTAEAAQPRVTRSAVKAGAKVVFHSLPDKQPAKKRKTAAEEGRDGKKSRAAASKGKGNGAKIKSTASEGESKGAVEVAEEESDEDDDGGGDGGGEARASSVDGSPEARTIGMEVCKQCSSFEKRVLEVMKCVENAIPAISVSINPLEPRLGWLDVCETEGKVFISLQLRLGCFGVCEIENGVFISHQISECMRITNGIYTLWPQAGCFEVQQTDGNVFTTFQDAEVCEIEGEVFASLLDMKAIFKAMNELNADGIINDIITRNIS